MTRHATLKTVSTLTALALTAMLATSAWANDPVHRINDRNSFIDQASVSVLTFESLTLNAMLATSAWANGPVYRINDRNSSIDQASVSVLTSESDAVAPLSAVALRERRFTKGQAVSSLHREISLFRGFGLSDQVLAEIELAVGN